MNEALKGLKGIQSVEFGGNILKLMAEAGRPLPLGELAKAAGMSASKARRYLISLSRLGMVEQDSATALYDLGWLSIRVGLAALSRRDIVRDSRPILRRLRDDINETVALVLWAFDGPTVAHFEEADRGVLRVVAQVGTTLPLLSTSAGQIFAAYLPATITKTMIDNERLGKRALAYALTKPVDAAEVEAILGDVRQRGIARRVGQPVEGINTVAAPVFDHGGDIAAVIVALGYKNTLDVKWNGRIATALKFSAAEISRNLGAKQPMTHWK
jgi:DNA-binding IclR family transcriptional regulator